MDKFYNPVPNIDVSISINSNLVETKKTDENGEVWYYFNASNSGDFTIEFSIPNNTIQYNISVIPQPSGSGIFDVYWLQGDSYYWNATLEGVLKDFGVKVEYNGNPVSGARVDFSTDNPAILSVLNAENVTDIYGETSVTVGCKDNGTVNLFATSGGSGDVITLNIENCGAVCPLIGWKYRVPLR